MDQIKLSVRNCQKRIPQIHEKSQMLRQTKFNNDVEFVQIEIIFNVNNIQKKNISSARLG